MVDVIEIVVDPVDVLQVVVEGAELVEVVEPGRQGPPGPQGEPGEPLAFEFVQSSPALSWTVNHNLGFRPSVTIRSVGGVEIVGSVLHVSANQTLIEFVIPVAGSARFV